MPSVFEVIAETVENNISYPCEASETRLGFFDSNGNAQKFVDRVAQAQRVEKLWSVDPSERLLAFRIE